MGIVGEVGAGKTCLVKALLGELRPPTNTAFTKSSNIRTAYCDQTPVIFNSTVRANVLFGLPMDEPLYFECIDSSCLQEDIDSFVDNDLTEIGEHGVNLSGGQRARLAFTGCLYHAKYNDPHENRTIHHVAIFDDPLSAVDVDVAHKCIRGLLDQGKDLTRILVVSSHMHLLEKADMIISLSKNGQMKDSGTFKEIFHLDHANSGKDPVQSLVASPELCHLSEVGERRCTTNVNSEANVNTELYTKTKEKRSNLVKKNQSRRGSQIESLQEAFRHGCWRFKTWSGGLFAYCFVYTSLVKRFLSIDRSSFYSMERSSAVSDQATLVIANNVNAGNWEH